ncbi:hypothetical protein QBC34DRAFT_107329 [Podospora aff. communis PSN243]|uniref:Uncharacterized protein n=1 Tax=Podospora aff. communis PSN243 TaxID=3040156 RepID=A0AAV9H374_9PEZI|nr:hypothetical protein QBC34DRAFT_107329 [Podospora aff. communis PSN243]
MARSRTSASLTAENLQPVPSSSQGEPGKGGAQSSRSSEELLPPAGVFRGRAPSSSSGEVLPIPFSQRSRAPSSSGDRQPASSLQRSRAPSSSRLQPPTFRRETTTSSAESEGSTSRGAPTFQASLTPSPRELPRIASRDDYFQSRTPEQGDLPPPIPPRNRPPRSRESTTRGVSREDSRPQAQLAPGSGGLRPQAPKRSIALGSGEPQRTAHREGPDVSNQPSSTAEEYQPSTLSKTLPRTPAHRYALFPKIVPPEQQALATLGSRGLQPAQLHRGRSPTPGPPLTNRRSGRPDFQPHATPGQKGLTSSPIVTREGPSVQTHRHVGVQPRSNLRQPKDDFGHHQSLSPGTIYHPQSQRPRQLVNDASLQYPTADMIATPQPATLQTTGVEQAGQSAGHPALANPSILPSQAVQSVEVLWAVQTVQTAQGFPDTRAALTPQTTRATYGSNTVDTTDIVQALQDVSNGPPSSPPGSTPTKGLRRRLLTRRPATPRPDRVSSSPPSTPDSTTAQESALFPPRRHLIPNNPHGYFPPPAFRKLYPGHREGQQKLTEK